MSDTLEEPEDGVDLCRPTMPPTQWDRYSVMSTPSDHSVNRLHLLRTPPPPAPGVRPLDGVSWRTHVLRPTDVRGHARSVPLSAGEGAHRSRFDQAAICPR